MTVKELRQQLHDWVDRGDTKILKMLYAISKVYFTEANPTRSDSPLYRLVYSSVRSESCDQDCIDKILASSVKNNPSKELTGMLLYSEDRFIQILEGPLVNVMETYNMILKDPRHGGSVIRYCAPTEERYFEDWHMGSKSIEEHALEFKTDISSEEKKLYNSLADGNLASYRDDSLRMLKTFLAF
ncbi:BLUF domain-containing protein [Marinoscillum pacificum]|uniref:BLUF domain-containing protein n=1 Tax=Marinoscillum pacificum TaxID=392723 RepID=UPI0021574A3D|nr:BLUF domain-containing protein [Marinoscillum pacificum]